MFYFALLWQIVNFLFGHSERKWYFHLIPHDLASITVVLQLNRENSTKEISVENNKLKKDIKRLFLYNIFFRFFFLLFLFFFCCNPNEGKTAPSYSLFIVDNLIVIHNSWLFQDVFHEMGSEEAKKGVEGVQMTSVFFFIVPNIFLLKSCLYDIIVSVS